MQPIAHSRKAAKAARHSAAADGKASAMKLKHILSLLSTFTAEVGDAMVVLCEMSEIGFERFGRDI